MVTPPFNKVLATNGVGKQQGTDYKHIKNNHGSLYTAGAGSIPAVFRR